MTPILAFGIAAVFGTLAVAPLSGEGRALVALGILALCAHASRSHEPRLVRASLLCALVLFALNAARARERIPTIAEHRTARYAGVTLGDVRDEGSASSFAVALDDGTTVLAHARGSAPAPGMRVLLRGRLTPFDEARNPGEPSEAALERERGLDAQIESAEVLDAAPAPRCRLRCSLARAHAWALDQLRRSMGEPAASVVAGELWGERSDRPPDLRAEFQETGTVHVLVTAG